MVALMDGFRVIRVFRGQPADGAVAVKIDRVIWPTHGERPNEPLFA